MLFCRFRLSANNWEEELSQVQDQADFVKENSPKIYKEMVEEGTNLERTREKERVYKEAQEKVEQISGMEKGVVKIVTILNVLGVSTSQSCEGHLDIEKDARIIRPFVEVSSPSQPEKRFVGQERIIPKVAKKYGMKEEDVRTMLLHSAPWEEFQNAKETEKYKAWRKENKKIAKRGEKILKEFYQDTAVPETDRLTINEQNSGQFEITNVGRGQEDILSGEQNLTQEQRAALEQQLSRYQDQMDNFASFLKEKYFTK
ncbi:MAG: hypothetical protein NTV36_02975 [Candidatus Staskawiczbacteria bacterium]|nr:hypothetical protein [Candidatus Staskawiczbacteria bacterium]